MTYLDGFLGGDKIFKKVFASTLLLLIISALFLSSFVHVFAQGGGADSGGAANPPSFGPGTFPIGGNGSGDAGNGSDGSGAGAGGTGGGAADSDQAPVAPVITPVGGTNDPILLVLHAIVTAVGWIAGQFGYMFDYAISNYIVGFGDKYINYNIGDVIDNLWSTVRDIFNLTFIFGLVYIGFKMILDSGDSSARKMLVSLIGAALLVNFSLFITKFIVDFSNIAAYQIYKAFAGSAANGEFSLTRAFMNQMGIDSLFSVPYIDGYQYILGLLIIFLVLAYVFLAGAIMIIIRFVVLNIYMVFSPLMFLGWVFPAMKGYSTKYWSGFLSQAFFAPAFLFMLYLSYRVADSYKYTGKDFNLIFNPQSSTFGGNATSVNEIIPYFAMVIVFLVASIVVAKKMGGTSASLGIAMTNKIRGGAQGVLAGGAGKYGKNKLDSWSNREDAPIRRSLARGATLLGVQDFADKQYKNSPQGNWAETKKKRAGELSTRTEDAKVKGAIAGAPIAGGAALETAVRGANQTQLISALRKHEVGSAGYKNIVNSLTQNQVNDLLKTKDDEFSATEKSNLQKNVLGAINTKISTNPGAIPKLTFDEIETLGDTWIMNANNLKLLTYSQVEKLEKDSKVLGNSQKANLKDSWKGAFNPAAMSAGDFDNVMKNRGPKDIAELPVSVLRDDKALVHLSDKVLKELATKLSGNDKAYIANNILQNPIPHHPSAGGYFNTSHARDNWY